MLSVESSFLYQSPPVSCWHLCFCSPDTKSEFVCVFQHPGEWRRPRCLRAPSLCEGLLLCPGGPGSGDSSDAAQRHSRQRKLCLLVPPRAQDSHGWDWTHNPEDSLSENQRWSCQGICEAEIWVPLHRGRHLSWAVLCSLSSSALCQYVQVFNNSFINCKRFFSCCLCQLR